MNEANYEPGRADPQPIEGDAAAVNVEAAPTLPLPLKGDTAKAVAFAIDLVGSGRFAVAAIHPETGACYGRTFTLPAARDSLSAWIEERQGKWNLHFALNEPAPQDQQRGKAGRIGKPDLSTLRGVVVDLDPSNDAEAQLGGFDRERERLMGVAAKMNADPCAPSAFIDSGGGVQAVWLFPKALPATPENITLVEAQSRGLAALYGGDTTNDAAHLFRLPWTVNLPNAVKRARGRKPALATGKVHKPWRFATLEDLAAFAPPIDRAEAPAAAPPFDTEEAWLAAGNPDALPDDLAERIADARARDGRFDKLLSDPAPEAGSQRRSDHDFHLACVAREAGMTDRADVAAVVAALGSDKYTERDELRGRALADRYLVNTIDKAFARVAKTAAQHTALLSPVADPDDTPDARVALDASQHEPLDIFGHDDVGELSTPPVGSLPGVIEPFIRTTAVQMGVPESFVAASAIAVLAGAIGNALTLRPREHSSHFKVPASLAVVIVARPGRKKSPTIKAALAPLRTLDGELHRTSAAKRAAWRAAHCTQRGQPKAGAPPQPPTHQFLVDDATVEKQVRIHADNPAGILRATDELSALLGSMGAYKRSGDGDRGTLLRMLDGDAVSFERVGGSVRAESAQMGVIASTQPDIIKKLTRDLGSDGFLQRLIFVMDDGAEREPLDAPSDPAALSDYERAVRGMAEIRKMGGGVVVLSPEARAILTATWKQIRDLQAIPGASVAWEGHIAKWEGLLYRIALTIHALDTWTAVEMVPTGPGTPVTAETARKAARLALFFVRHALRFYSEFYEPADHSVEAREIAGYLLAHPDVLSFTPRYIEKARRPLQGQRRLTLAALSALENAGWVSVAERGAEGPTKWAVNPQIHIRFIERAKREKEQRAQGQQQIAAALSAQRRLRDAV